jgi:predicted restriction endonuclease
VNAESNLVPLCPNHHWEFDHGLIPIERIALSSKL